MKKYQYSVSEPFTGYSLIGEIEAKNEEDAISQLKEIYAQEFNTTEDMIEVEINP